MRVTIGCWRSEESQFTSPCRLKGKTTFFSTYSASEGEKACDSYLAHFSKIGRQWFATSFGRVKNGQCDEPCSSISSHSTPHALSHGSCVYSAGLQWSSNVFKYALRPSNADSAQAGAGAGVSNAASACGIMPASLSGCTETSASLYSISMTGSITASPLRGCAMHDQFHSAC
jgi:hypothetical protein